MKAREVDAQVAARFIADRYVENGLLDSATALEIITSRLTRPGRTVFVVGDPIEAAGCLVIRRNSARVTCLASKSTSAVIAIFEAIGSTLLDRGIVSLRAKVHPKYTKFYQRVIGAEVSSRTKQVEAVGGADGVGIRLVLDREKVSRLHSWKTRVLG